MSAPGHHCRCDAISADAVERGRDFIARAHWQSAKSTEDVAPHQYVVLGWDRDDITDAEFWSFASLIKAEGRLEEWTPPPEWVRRWGGKPMTNRYLYIGDFAYWFTWPKRSVPMLNRERQRPEHADEDAGPRAKALRGRGRVERGAWRRQ